MCPTISPTRLRRQNRHDFYTICFRVSEQSDGIDRRACESFDCADQLVESLTELCQSLVGRFGAVLLEQQLVARVLRDFPQR